MYVCGYVFVCAVEGGNTSNDWVFHLSQERCFTMFYYVLVSLHTSTFVMLNCLTGLFIVEFDWSQKPNFHFAQIVKNNQALLFVCLLACLLPCLFKELHLAQNVFCPTGRRNLNKGNIKTKIFTMPPLVQQRRLYEDRVSSVTLTTTLQL